VYPIASFEAIFQWNFIDEFINEFISEFINEFIDFVAVPSACNGLVHHRICLVRMS
jgi:hypothetical protein